MARQYFSSAGLFLTRLWFRWKAEGLKDGAEIPPVQNSHCIHQQPRLSLICLQHIGSAVPSDIGDPQDDMKLWVWHYFTLQLGLGGTVISGRVSRLAAPGQISPSDERWVFRHDAFGPRAHGLHYIHTLHG
jgi:hypothetical protein